LPKEKGKNNKNKLALLKWVREREKEVWGCRRFQEHEVHGRIE
jgi:hypothetical protein